MDPNVLNQLETSLTALLDRVIQSAAVSGIPAAGDTVAGIAKLINNLSSNDPSSALSAQQGNVLKGLIDTINSRLTNADPSIQTLTDVSHALGLVNTALTQKVNAVAGKGLSTVDFSNEDKIRLDYLNPNRYERIVFQDQDGRSGLTNITLVTKITTETSGGYDLHIDVFNGGYTSFNRIRLSFYMWQGAVNTYHVMVTGRGEVTVRLAVRPDGRIVIHLGIEPTYYPTVRVYAIPGPGAIYPSIQTYDNFIETALFNDPNLPTYSIYPPITHNTTIHTGNVVGVVNAASNSIIQMGSGINGSFIRLRGGLQLCWHKSLEHWGPLTSDAGAHYSDALRWTFPAAFLSSPLTWYVPAEIVSFNGQPTWALSCSKLSSGSPTTVDDFPFYIMFSQPGGFTYRVNCFAIGLWG